MENIRADEKHVAEIDSTTLRALEDDGGKSAAVEFTHNSPATESDDQTDDNSDAESVGGQKNTMSSKRLMVAIPALSVCLFVSFVDQTSVSTATPAIAGYLNTGTATSWIGTSFFIASTAFQLINGRLKRC